MRYLLTLQLLSFLIFGMFSGNAIKNSYEYELQCLQISALANMSLRELSNIDVRRTYL